jgi:hypothetical protein
MKPAPPVMRTFREDEEEADEWERDMADFGTESIGSVELEKRQSTDFALQVPGPFRGAG